MFQTFFLPFKFQKEIKLLRNYVLIALIAIICSYSVYFLYSAEKIIRLGEENSFFELGTALCFLISSILFIFLFVKKKNIFFLLLGLLLFLGAGEELSWGQHIFKFKTPEKIRENNVQGELNLHNIEIFNTDKFNNCRKSGIERLLEINLLFRLFCIIYGILIPFAFTFFSPFKKLIENFKLPVPPLEIGVFFMVNWIIYKLTLLLVANHMPIPYYETSTEIFEFNASLIWLLIGYYFFLDFRKDSIRIKVS